MSFTDWADENDLTPEERVRVRQAAEERGYDPDGINTEQLDEIAESVGIFVRGLRRLFDWFRGLF